MMFRHETATSIRPSAAFSTASLGVATGTKSKNNPEELATSSQSSTALPRAKPFS